LKWQRAEKQRVTAVGRRSERRCVPSTR
jgi:hypothetical protein